MLLMDFPGGSDGKQSVCSTQHMVRLAADAVELHSCSHVEDDFEAALMKEDIITFSLPFTLAI